MVDLRYLCKVCNMTFADETAFHKHFRAHKLTIEKYYCNFWDKRDFQTNEPVPFKSREQYIETDFINRENLVKWTLEKDPNIVKPYIKNLLIKRKVKKNLIYSPSHVELKSVLLPSSAAYDKLFPEGYYGLCDSIGLINKYKQITYIPQFNDDYEVICDSREQLALPFRGAKIEKLDYGDYKLYNEDRAVYFERKSAQDLVGTLSSGIERFHEEIKRAEGQPLIIIVERKLRNMMQFKDRNIYRQTKVTPEFIFRHVRDLIQQYPNIQFLFADRRVECIRIMEKIFKTRGKYIEIDLELAYSSKIL